MGRTVAPGAEATRPRAMTRPPPADSVIRYITTDISPDSDDVRGRLLGRRAKESAPNNAYEQGEACAAAQAGSAVGPRIDLASRWTRSASTIASMATIRRPRTVKPMIEKGRPSPTMSRPSIVAVPDVGVSVVVRIEIVVRGSRSGHGRPSGWCLADARLAE